MAYRNKLKRLKDSRSIKIPPRLAMFLSFGGTSALQYVFGLIMAWLLLPGDFGLLAFVQSIILIAELILQDGFPWALARKVANVDGPRKGALLRGALISNLGLAIVMSMVLVMLFALGPLQSGLESGTLVVIIGFTLPFESLASTVRGYAQGHNRFGIVAAVELVEVSCRVPVGIVLVLLGFGVEGAVVGFGVGALLAATLGSYCLIYRLGTPARGTVEFSTLHAVGPIFGALLGLSLLVNLDLVALKLLSNARELTGYYQAGRMLANIPYYLVMTVIVQVLFVKLARIQHIRATPDVMGETLRLVATLILPLEIILIIVPEQALGAFFPVSYVSGASVLRLLAIGNSILMLVGIFSVAFQALGRAKVAALILLAVTFVETIPLLVFVPTQEAIGAATVFVAAAFLALLSLAMVYLFKVGPRVINRRVVSWLLRYVMAVGIGIAGGYSVFKLGLHSNLAVVVGSGCYLASLFALRLLRTSAIRPLLQKIVITSER